MISTEPVITVSPTETTRYRLKVQTAKGLVDYTDILVYVLDILNCHFDYSTGDVVSQYGTVLTKNQALSRNWNANGSSILTTRDFTSLSPALTCTNKGGIVFQSQCFVPKDSETLIAGISVDSVLHIDLFNNKIQINSTEYPFSVSGETGVYLTFEIAVTWQPDSSQYEFRAAVWNSRTQELVISESELASIGTPESDVSLYFIGSSTAKAGFYYGTNGEPVPIIHRSALSVSEGSDVVLDGSDSYDPDNEAISCQWYYKKYSDSRFKKLYKTDEVITESVSGSVYYRLAVSDFENTVATEVLVTNYTVQELSPGCFEISAVLDDVRDLYSYQWSASDGSLESTERTVVVEPFGAVTYQCLITELSTGVSDTVEIQLEGDSRVIHARNIHSGEYQEIRVYPDTRLLQKYIECKVDGYQGYVAVGGLDNPKRSMLKCKFPGDSEIYAVLLRV